MSLFWICALLYFAAGFSLQPSKKTPTGSLSSLYETKFIGRSKPTVPNLILISGCTGTGKSTLGMEVAIQKGILKCISTDTIRQTMRAFIDSPALHRSSFQGDGDALKDWRECCTVLDVAIESIVMDSVKRGTSLVLEGVHIVPSNMLIEMWNQAGGFAVGAVLTIPDPEMHKRVIFRRGEETGKGADLQVAKFNRIRAIHDEMLRLGKQNDWAIIEQRPILEPMPTAQPDPLLTLNEFIDQRSLRIAKDSMP